jgi:hypothetical protein
MAADKQERRGKFMNMIHFGHTDAQRVTELGEQVGSWVQDTIGSATNKVRLQGQLDSIGSDLILACFLHRFALFNDALAARVPFLAGVIHLTPDLFLDWEADEEFCRQCNGRIAAFVALAASDEYLITDRRSMAHQYLSQRFFRSTLAHLGFDGPAFDRANPVPPLLSEVIIEARTKFFDRKGPEHIFAALGFHIGLEFFANEEFNLVDMFLRNRYPGLVAKLEQDDGEGNSYEWLAIHTVVEVGHYRAGLEALKAAVKHYRSPGDAPAMAEKIKEGLRAFMDLQGRYYEAIFCDLH